MSPAQAEKLFKILTKARPNPTTELVYHSPFELLVAVILSAQATDISVNRGTQHFFPRYNTPQALLEWGEEAFFQAVQHIGLAPTKTKHVMATCRLLLERHQGQVPDSRAALEALPGVGRKTANVILNTAFGHPTLAVDTHVARVARRTGLAVGTTPLQVEHELLHIIPQAYLPQAHHTLILHGRYVCQARTPACTTCPITTCCDFFKKNTP